MPYCFRAGLLEGQILRFAQNDSVNRCTVKNLSVDD